MTSEQQIDQRPKRLRGPYRKPVDRASDNTFPVQGPRGDRRTRPPCLNGSYLRKRKAITLAERA